MLCLLFPFFNHVCLSYSLILLFMIEMKNLSTVIWGTNSPMVAWHVMVATYVNVSTTLQSCHCHSSNLSIKALISSLWRALISETSPIGWTLSLWLIKVYTLQIIRSKLVLTFFEKKHSKTSKFNVSLEKVALVNILELILLTKHFKPLMKRPKKPVNSNDCPKC